MADTMRASRRRGGVRSDLRHDFGCAWAAECCCHEVSRFRKKGNKKGRCKDAIFKSLHVRPSSGLIVVSSDK